MSSPFCRETRDTIIGDNMQIQGDMLKMMVAAGEGQDS